MKTSFLEITDNQYLIKLDKADFDLSFINNLLKRIQTEQTFFIRNWDDDKISRRLTESSENFDHLSEK